MGYTECVVFERSGDIFATHTPEMRKRSRWVPDAKKLDRAARKHLREKVAARVVQANGGAATSR